MSVIVYKIFEVNPDKTYSFAYKYCLNPHMVKPLSANRSVVQKGFNFNVTLGKNSKNSGLQLKMHKLKKMATKKVYRIEHKTRMDEFVTSYCGPYKDSAKWGDKKRNTHVDADHPGSSPDSKFYDKLLSKKRVSHYSYFLYGFESLEDLKKWFSPTELKRLFKLNYVIAEYDSNHYAVGKNQVAFVPQMTTRKIVK